MASARCSLPQEQSIGSDQEQEVGCRHKTHLGYVQADVASWGIGHRGSHQVKVGAVMSQTGRAPLSSLSWVCLPYVLKRGKHTVLC